MITSISAYVISNFSTYHEYRQNYLPNTGTTQRMQVLGNTEYLTTAIVWMLIVM